MLFFFYYKLWTIICNIRASSVIKEAVNTDSIKQIISEDNETTDTAIDVSDQSSNLTTDKVSNVTCSWEDSEVPIEVGNDNSKSTN